MSKLFENLSALDNFGNINPITARERAVGAALAVIQAKAGNSPEFGAALQQEFENLSTYADQIQAALKVK